MPFKTMTPVWIGVAIIILVGAVVGIAQIPTGAGPSGAVAIATPSTTATGGPDAPAPATVPSSAPGSTAPDATGPATAAPGPEASAPPSEQPAPAPEPAQPTVNPPAPAVPPAAAPAPPPAAAADTAMVKRVTDSCSLRLQSDAANSGAVAGTAVGRPYTVVALEFTGAPQRSTAASGLASYDVAMKVTTQMSNGPARTAQRVCRVYDYDSHVDWLPAS